MELFIELLGMILMAFLTVVCFVLGEFTAEVLQTRSKLVTYVYTYAYLAILLVSVSFLADYLQQA